jgi:hypothetical protein
VHDIRSFRRDDSPDAPDTTVESTFPNAVQTNSATLQLTLVVGRALHHVSNGNVDAGADERWYELPQRTFRAAAGDPGDDEQQSH